MIRLIATDMDGTLLTDEPLILPETADVLRRAAEKGIVLSLASGRLPDDASFFAVDAKLPMHVIALNGAVTLGTMDGANVEIHDLVGEQNIYTFGKSSAEVMKLYAENSYCPAKIYDGDPVVEKLVDFIVDKKMIRLGDPVQLGRLYKELVGKDYFMTLLDLREYIDTKEQMLADYENRREWSRKSLVNIARAGYFSADRTIEGYNRDIWKLERK